MIWLLACTTTVPPAVTAPAPTFDTSCRANEECAPVYAIAGLDAPPADVATATCGDLCTTAIRAADVERWNTLRRELEPSIRCTNKRAKCPTLDGVGAACVAGACVVIAK